MNVEWMTNEELIEELYNRKTFVGFIAYSADNHKFEDQQHKDFRVKSTLSEEGTAEIAEKIKAAIQK